jgi:Aspartyl/asparaginyl-tRNA synthetases
LSIVTARVLIKDLAALPDGPVSVAGWVETVRDQKKVQFVVLRDESGAVQLVNPRTVDEDGGVVADEPATTISGLSQGSFVRATGELKHDERVKLGGIEIKLNTLEVETAASPRRRSPRTAASTSGWTGASSTSASRSTT